MLVVDRSEAMRGVSMEAIRAGLHAALDRVPPGVIVGVLGFDRSVVEVVPLAALGDRAVGHRAIDSLDAGGGSDLVAAMMTAARQLAAAPGPVRHIVLLAGSASSDRHVDDLIAALAAADITVTAIILTGSDRPLLYRIVTMSGGGFYRVGDVAGLGKIYVDIIENALVVEQALGVRH
jgi:hypothetical protein